MVEIWVELVSVLRDTDRSSAGLNTAAGGQISIVLSADATHLCLRGDGPPVHLVGVVQVVGLAL